MADPNQPNEVKTPEEYREMFQTDAVLWFNDGRWGLCGYGIPNGQGKTWTLNTWIYHIHKLCGEMLFDLAHRESVRFKQPPHKDFWWDWHKAIVSARGNLMANRMDPGTTLNIKEGHVTSNKQTFVVYPVPFFGERVRQEDVRMQMQLCLRLLGELMQHGANERAYYIDGTLVDLCVGLLNEMLKIVAIKYFAFDPKEVAAAGSSFVIPPDRFNAENYTPQNRIPSTEMSTERPPMLWWPTENDLSAIRGIAYTDALLFAQRWPVTHLEGEGAWENTLPGIIDRVRRGDQTLAGQAAKAQQMTGGQFAP
jgi:hypothetical protein